MRSHQMSLDLDSADKQELVKHLLKISENLARSGQPNTENDDRQLVRDSYYQVGCS